MYQVTRLKSGLTIATAEMPHMASLSLGIWVGVGSRYEPAPVSGISHFIEHMLFKGTRRRSAKQISQSVEGIGGYLNAWTAEENTCFYSKARHDKLDELFDVLVDMFSNSVFDPGELEKERNVIKEEIAMYRDQPHLYVQELLNTTMWPGQPLGRTITGTEKTVDSISRDQIVGYLKKNYVAPCTLITAAGRLRHQDVVKAVMGAAKKFSGIQRPNFSPAVVRQTAPIIKLHTKKTEQTQVALGIRGCSRHDERRYALRVLNAILGENMSSRLFQSVREEHGLAYSIYSSPSFFEDTGDLVISAGIDTGKLKESLVLILRELQKMKESLPSAGELRRARDYIVGQLEMNLENTEPQMIWIGENLLGYGKIFSLNEIKRRLDELTCAQIRSVAREFFRPERLNLALVSPLKSVAGLENVFRI